MITLYGIVQDSNGSPLAGVNVLDDSGFYNGTSTDFDGQYTIELPELAKIKFSSIGFISKTYLAKSTPEVVRLEENVNDLDTVDLGTVKRKSTIGALLIFLIVIFKLG